MKKQLIGCSKIILCSSITWWYSLFNKFIYTVYSFDSDEIDIIALKPVVNHNFSIIFCHTAR